ncbi:MAG: hypothetical protein WAQ53_06300 [Thiofilum sp.]|uniref:hypothetical protein n=1 Tax=Thiofilum sp. TaxID=2212733 RepID=UPI0025E16172|nr:hypothetical protein [Thiofilum sp.]MBK8455216.1 hypothetical protein [Thiofilum sp.]
MTIKALIVAGLTTLTLTATPNLWAGNVSWSITIGNGGHGGYRPHYRPHYIRPRPVVVVSSRPVYHRPRPVVVHPRPVYVKPRPVVVTHRPRPVYHRPRPVVVIQNRPHYNYHRPRPTVVINRGNYHRGGHYQRARHSGGYRSHSANSRLY